MVGHALLLAASLLVAPSELSVMTWNVCTDVTLSDHKPVYIKVAF